MHNFQISLLSCGVSPIEKIPSLTLISSTKIIYELNLVLPKLYARRLKKGFETLSHKLLIRSNLSIQKTTLMLTVIKTTFIVSIKRLLLQNPRLQTSPAWHCLDEEHLELIFKPMIIDKIINIFFLLLAIKFTHYLITMVRW